jgi:hypothetical protein
MAADSKAGTAGGLLGHGGILGVVVLPIWPGAWYNSAANERAGKIANEKLAMPWGQAFEGCFLLSVRVSGFFFMAAFLSAAFKFGWSE